MLVDTWQNFEDNDPAYDHIAIHKNGIIDHSPSTDVAQAVTALPTGGNIEDCKWHTLRISWDPAAKTLKTQVDGADRVQAVIDLVNDIFNGDDLVFWGFTAATGGAKNLQKICTSLNPGFALPVGQTTCFPEAVTFIDSSASFGTIEKWYWDFGDGTTYNESSPPPHSYTQPGNYNVKLAILGNNGCISDTFSRTIVMGTKPVVRYSYPSPVCEEIDVNFLDSSVVEYGTVNKWTWTINGTVYSDQHPPPLRMTGESEISLVVETAEGCISDVSGGKITAFPTPEVNFEASDVCYNSPVNFFGTNSKPSVAVSQWNWSFGNGISIVSESSHQRYFYPDGGEYVARLIGMSEDGCLSNEISKTVKVHQTNAYAGNDTIVAKGQSFQLNGSGGEIYKWTPSTGLSNDNVSSPMATLEKDTELILTASTVAGCATTDSVRIKVYEGPNLYVPSAFSPNNDGINDRFEFIAVGMRSVDLFQVYNRYGQLIYSSTTINRGWDGRLNGLDQPGGAYVWMIKGTDMNGITHFKRGTVTLIR